jgi:hypothetical protein
MTKTLSIIAALLVATTFAAQAKAKTEPQTQTWFCEVTDDGVKIYKANGSGGGKRKRDAVCE